EFSAMSARTFGVDSPDTLAQFRQGTGLPNVYPAVGPVVINEVMYHPPDINGTNDDVLSEYIELRNITTSDVQLFDPTHPTNPWQLRAAVSFKFPQDTTIPANGLILVVAFDPSDTAQLNAFRSKWNVSLSAVVVGPWHGKLDNSDDSIELTKPDLPQLP